MRIRWIYKGVVADVEERVHQVFKKSTLSGDFADFE